MNGKQPMPLPHHINTATGTCFPGRYSPTYRTTDPMRRHCMGNPAKEMCLATVVYQKDVGHPYCNGPSQSRPAYTTNIKPDWHVIPLNRLKNEVSYQGNLFAGLDDGLMGRAEALAAVDISNMTKHSPVTSAALPLKHDMMYAHHPGMTASHGVPSSRSHQMGHHGMDTMDLLEPICPSSLPPLTMSTDSGTVNSHSHQLHGPIYSHSMNTMMASHPALTSHHAMAMHDIDADPRELEAFAERFKQRRIKLGVTQADVGKALANLKLPGVGSLSQSTICRFESLTLSHNNMVALKPILMAWLEAAEAQAKCKRRDPEAPSVLPSGEKKRKRTSIAAPEKRSLEAYFAVQPRPSGEKIAAIAEKLELKKNVVRVWFCNQRQKQKRMKYSAVQH